MSEVSVVASCPEIHHDRMVDLCRKLDMVKAFGKAGDMINKLDGKEWIPKWQARVVQAVSQAATNHSVKRIKIICIQGGSHCDAELSHQPKLKKAIDDEIKTLGLQVSCRVEWLQFNDFIDIYTKESISITTKNKSLKDTVEISKTVAVVHTTSTKDTTSNFLCDQCSKLFMNKDSFQKHQQSTGHVQRVKLAKPQAIKANIEDIEAATTCDECGKSFKSLESFFQHQTSTGHLSCKFCGKCFNSQESLHQHEQSTGHRNGYSFKESTITCEECRKSFKESEFSQHQTLTGHVSCKICKIGYITYEGLHLHEQRTGHGMNIFQTKTAHQHQYEPSNFISMYQSELSTYSIKELKCMLKDHGCKDESAHCVEKSELVAIILTKVVVAISTVMSMYQSELNAYSTKELKCIIQAYGLTDESATCVEKSELVELLLKYAPLTFQRTENGIIYGASIGNQSSGW